MLPNFSILVITGRNYYSNIHMFMPYDKNLDLLIQFLHDKDEVKGITGCHWIIGGGFPISPGIYFFTATFNKKDHAPSLDNIKWVTIQIVDDWTIG